MSLFNRIANLTKASLHEVLNKLENPVIMTGQYLRNLEDDIRIAENMLKEQQMNASIRLRKSEDAANAAKESELRALAALEAGDEAGAKVAAAAKIRYEEQAQQYATEAKEAQDRVAELEYRLKEGKEEHARLKEKRNELATRVRKVEEHEQMERPNFSRGMDYGAAARGFERMEEKILEWEAGTQLSGQSYTGSGASSATNPEDNTAVAEELQRMKEQLASRKN
ncbi:phage shock protein A (PspA) family protein [Fontibacillus phaseoli]|uniref:Phage shock protein A (PspA) family protein n=1 Tax=Fontibacillus phaseoli TaxID=1416533 RepID=A0A369BCF1_9BACL|nr:PspA/IM30 family protein [Fontibacillus phaseoli]RCX18137.1 phage shock protein A (PspA) family protein [Fontibacillus phaseoli]